MSISRFFASFGKPQLRLLFLGADFLIKFGFHLIKESVSINAGVDPVLTLAFYV